MKVIAHIHTDFPEKFGIPRQSGLVESLQGRIVFEPPYRNPEALRGLEAFSHIWLIWEFSQSVRQTWSPTVRPPRLGAMPVWGYLLPVPPFGPIPSACPVYGWKKFNTLLIWGPFCMCWAQIWWMVRPFMTLSPICPLPIAILRRPLALPRKGYLMHWK